MHWWTSGNRITVFTWRAGLPTIFAPLLPPIPCSALYHGKSDSPGISSAGEQVGLEWSGAGGRLQCRGAKARVFLLIWLSSCLASLSGSGFGLALWVNFSQFLGGLRSYQAPPSLVLGPVDNPSFGHLFPHSPRCGSSFWLFGFHFIIHLSESCIKSPLLTHQAQVLFSELDSDWYKLESLSSLPTSNLTGNVCTRIRPNPAKTHSHHTPYPLPAIEPMNIPLSCFLLSTGILFAKYRQERGLTLHQCHTQGATAKTLLQRSCLLHEVSVMTRCQKHKQKTHQEEITKSSNE